MTKKNELPMLLTALTMKHAYTDKKQGGREMKKKKNDRKSKKLMSIPTKMNKISILKRKKARGKEKNQRPTLGDNET